MKEQNILNKKLKNIFPQYAKVLRGTKKVIESIFFAIVFVSIPVIAITLITSRSSALAGMQSFTVLSGSMSPVIPTGSIVYTQPAERIDRGDVITFKRNNVNITHRVIDITDKEGNSVTNLISPLPGAPVSSEIFYKTKGDANNAADSELVSVKDVIGRTFVSIEGVGGFSGYLKTIPGFLFFIILPTLIFIGFELWNIKKEIEKQAEKRILERFGKYESGTASLRGV